MPHNFESQANLIPAGVSGNVVHIPVSANVDPPPLRTTQLLIRCHRINAAYEKINNNSIAKVGWGLFIAYGMALYNYLKESGQGNQATAVASAIVSLICNMLISYAYCLKAPFVAAAILVDMRKNIIQSLSVFAALAASGALTAQLINGQPLLWQILIGISAFANYLLTRTSGIVDNNNSAKNNALTVMVGIGVLCPLGYIWVSDIQDLFGAPTILDMASNHLSIKSYMAGSATAIFGIVGALLTMLFYCQAIKSIPQKMRALYHSWCHFIGNNLGFDPNSMKVKVISGLLTTITAGLLGYTGYYSMEGFNVAVLTALQCMPNSGELCWLTNALGLSSALIDFLAKTQQCITGLVNTSALVPAFKKFLQSLTVNISSNHPVPAIPSNDTPNCSINHDASPPDDSASSLPFFSQALQAGPTYNTFAQEPPNNPCIS